MMRVSSVLAFLCPLLTCMTLASAKGFLETENAQIKEDANVSDLLAVLLSERHTEEAAHLPTAVRNRHETDGHVWNEETLRAMFDALPKNDEGHIGLPAARYVLHRLFEDRHRWFVHGLHPTSNTSGSLSEVGKALQHLGESDLAGMNLQNLASLASTLEELILGELARHLSNIYAARSQHNDSFVTGSFLKEIAHDYLTIYISGADFSENSREDIAEDEAFMKSNTKDWKETQMWLNETIEAQFKKESSCKSDNFELCKFDFDASLRVLKHVVENYGFFNDRECHKVKSALLDVEVPQTGRVKLADFYQVGLSGAWQFGEKIEYLRSLGALDETVPSQPKVIVANYVSSWVNCLTPSKFYSVCCRNECEDYMKTIEKEITGPSADVDTLMRVIATQFKADAPSNLDQLRQRLTGIADKNGGKINIHGRLFAQWMHHAFPRTCPFPHEAGTTNPMTPDEWLMETGHENIKASESEMQQFLSAQQGELPWSDTEELVIVQPSSSPETEEDSNVSDMLAVLLSEMHTEEAAHLPTAVRNRHETDGHAWNEETLRVMFDALPKNSAGHIGLPAARYVLHRLFEDRHRWFVHGLHPTTNSSGSSSEVGKALQNLGESDLAGMNLQNLASLASTLEELIQGELARHLSSMYAARSKQNDSSVSGRFLKEIAHDYLTIYISGADFSENSREDVAEDEAFMKNNTKDWKDTQEWLAETIAAQFKKVTDCKSDNFELCEFDFRASLRVLKHVVENYGFFNDRECHNVKSALLDVEVPRTGRVKLADFYKVGLSGAWQFGEKIEYLRALGALDESVPSQPKVIVTNYVSSWVNCLSPSKFYSVCCRNECEDYMKIIEKEIAGPSSDVDSLMRVVTTQFKADAPANLLQLKQRLRGIADKSGGKIHVHGRLFAQWMHHAFPRTCPFPHEAGITNPMTPDDWLMETGHENIKASEAEVQQVLNTQKTADVEDREAVGAGELPWSDTEELLIVRPNSPPKAKPQSSSKGTIFIEVLSVIVLTSFVFMLASSWRDIRKSMHIKSIKHRA